jgi:hypothetical protein
MAVRITTSPIGPRIHRKTPEVKKAMIINTAPTTKRKIPSPFSTFFVFTAGFSSLDPGATRYPAGWAWGMRHNKNEISFPGSPSIATYRQGWGASYQGT